MSDIRKNIRVDDDLDDYKGFFDHELSKRLQETCRETKLSSAGFDLMAAWKGISEARRFPWLMIQAVNAAIEGIVNFSAPIPGQILNELVNRIATGLEVHHISLSSTDREALCSEIRSIESNIAERAKVPLRLNPNELWSHFLRNQGIALSLLMSEVNAYASVYFAYENYLIRSVKVVGGLESFRTSGLQKRVEGLLGRKVAEMCWSEEQIEMSRLVRHAIVHNGRKITKDLGKYQDDLILEDDEVVILAHHTTELYKLLHERALLFATEMAKLPQVKLSAT